MSAFKGLIYYLFYYKWNLKFSVFLINCDLIKELVIRWLVVLFTVTCMIWIFIGVDY